MICVKCGESFQNDYAYCPYCGRKQGNLPRKPRQRGNGSGSVFFNPKTKTWTAQITIGSKSTDPAKQRQSIRKTKKGFKKKSDAIDYLPVLKAAGATKPKEAPRLIHYWETFKETEYTQLGKSKQTAYSIAWEKLAVLHHANVDAISVSDLRDAVSEKCKTFYPARDCKSLLTRLFEMAAAEGFANKDLPSFIKLPSLEEKEQVPFSETEQASLWRLYESGDLRAAIPLLMIYTGMMPGEAMKLKTDQIDLENRRITGAGMKTKVRKATPIVLANDIIPVVEDLIAHANQRGFIWDQNEEKWRRQYYEALEAAKCRKLPPYSCRHTTATALAISEGIAPQTVKKVMRWSTTKMLDRYAHPQLQDQLDAVDSIKRTANSTAN